MNDVLDFRKLDEHTLVLSPAPEDVTAFVDRVCRQCRSFIREDVALMYRVAPVGVVASFDARRLFQILMNGLRWGGGGPSRFRFCLQGFRRFLVLLLLLLRFMDGSMLPLPLSSRHTSTSCGQRAACSTK